MKIRFILPLISLAILSCDGPKNTSSLEQPDSPLPGSNQNSPRATSHHELAQLLIAALDNEDYDAVAQLMAPAALIKILEDSEEAQKYYANLVARTPQQAKILHTYLKHLKLTPLKGIPIRKHQSSPDRIKTEGGVQFERSTGIRLLNNEGTIAFELADMACSVDGVWYLTQLLDKRTEMMIREKFPDLIEAIDK
ncbi:MAG: hypothetical protein ACON4R_13675 [Akkermansiaceae bacterium]